jgi:chaperonin GroES
MAGREPVAHHAHRVAQPPWHPAIRSARRAFLQSRTMSTRPSAKRSEYDLIEPIGKRVVVRKDDNKRQTKSGIVLPDSHEIPVITGRVIAISKAIENDEDQTIRQYDKVLFDPREAIPVELEHDNRLFVVHLDRVLAIFRRSDGPKATRGEDAADE